MLKTVAGRVKEQLNIDLEVSGPVRNHLAEAGFDERYGARPLRRVIQNEIEDELAEEYLAGRVKNGDHVVLRMKDGKIRFTV